MTSIEAGLKSLHLLLDALDDVDLAPQQHKKLKGAHKALEAFDKTHIEPLKKMMGV